MFSFGKKDRSYFVVRGANLVKQKLEDEAMHRMKIQEKVALRNSEILSGHIEISDSVPEKMKKMVTENKKNIRKVIESIASEAEENEYKLIEQSLNKMRFSKIDRQRLDNFFSSQKNLTLSFNSLKLVIDIFSKVNETVKQEIEAFKKVGREAYSQALLKHSILVYELTRFVINYIDSFNLQGVAELEAVEKEVLKDIHDNKDRELQQRKNLENNSSNVDLSVQKMAFRMSEDRLEILELIEKKWEDFFTKVRSLENSLPTIKNLSGNLKIVQSNAERQIDIIQLITALQVLDSNLTILQEIAGLKAIELEPLTPQDACLLLGLSDTQTHK